MLGGKTRAGLSRVIFSDPYALCFRVPAWGLGSKWSDNLLGQENCPSRSPQDWQCASLATQHRQCSACQVHLCRLVCRGSSTGAEAALHTYDPGRPRAYNPQLRGPMPYPLGHRTSDKDGFDAPRFSCIWWSAPDDLDIIQRWREGSLLGPENASVILRKPRSMDRGPYPHPSPQHRQCSGCQVCLCAQNSGTSRPCLRAQGISRAYDPSRARPALCADAFLIDWATGALISMALICLPVFLYLAFCGAGCGKYFFQDGKKVLYLVRKAVWGPCV